jgi:AraC family transcriptional regulator of adaptative response/methylated-DNA-[protein]-cysteine methyltransferase
MLKKSFVQTPFGSLVSVADDNFLYLLQFADSFLLNKQLNRIEKAFGTSIVLGSNSLTKKLEQELMAYCKGTLKKFTIPLFAYGTPFQKQVWDSCFSIEYGKTVCYQNLAEIMKNALASRAVGTALGSNCHVIIVPCHRIIKLNGMIGGYAGGVDRKLQLRSHEQLF